MVCKKPDMLLFVCAKNCRDIHIGDVMNLVPALPKDMHAYEAIFIPINDGDPSEANSGTHWSLLVYVRAVNSFYYYDTLKFNNLSHAESTCKRIQPLLHVNTPSQLIPTTTPQQDNGFDCGGNIFFYMV